MFKRIFGIKFLLVVLTFLAVWGLTLLSWHNSFRVPSAWDFAFGFVVLPTALCAGCWSVSELFKRLTEPSAMMASTEVGDWAGNVDPSLPSQLEIRDWALSLPVGNTLSEVLPIIAEAAMPDFHPTSMLDRRRAANAARANISSDADFIGLDNMQDVSAVFLIHKTLTLAAPVLKELLNRYMIVQALAANDSRGILHIHYLIPERWGAESEGEVRPWLFNQLDELLGNAQPYETAIAAVANASQALTYLDDLNVRINTQQTDALHLVLVSDSFVDEDSLGDKKAPSRSGSFVPGEGACALLLARRPAPAEPSLYVTLERMVTAQRSEAIDDPDDVDIQNTAALVTQSNPDGAAVAFVMTDAGNDRRQRDEVIAVITATLPKVKVAKSCYNLPVSCGEMGAVTPFAALALAAAQSIETKKAGLLISVSDQIWRAALLVHPPSKIDETATTGTPV